MRKLLLLFALMLPTPALAETIAFSLGSAAFVNTGTSGSTLCLLNTACTYSGALTGTVAQPDGTTTFTMHTASPSITETTANNTSPIPLRGFSSAPSVGAGNTKLYTSTTGPGIVAYTGSPTVTSGAAGSAAIFNGFYTQMNNAAPGTFTITNAQGVWSRTMTGTNGFTYATSGSFDDQSNATTGNFALMVGGAGLIAIPGNFSLYNRSVVGSYFAGALTLNDTFTLNTNVALVAAKSTVTGSAPGAGLCKTYWVAGTLGGTGKMIAYCGTSTTPTTIVDNVGSGF